MVESEVVAVIPARGGSKGVRRKNLREVAGVSLLGHSIRCAVEAKSVHRVFVSTEDEEISIEAIRCGAEVISRPAELAGDTSSSEAALLHALEVLRMAKIEPDAVVFLQCTSPLRTPSHIDGAVAEFRESSADSLLSVCRNHRFLWHRSDEGARPINYNFGARPRRQDMEPQFMENGSIYVFRPDVLRVGGARLGGRIALYEMPEVSSVEVDSESDLIIIGALFEGWVAQNGWRPVIA